MNKPIIIPPALEAILVSLVTRGLAALGAAIVSHGVATSDQVNAAVSPLSQIIVGAILTIGGLVWGAIRAKVNNDNLTAIKTDPATTVPDRVAVLKKDL